MLPTNEVHVHWIDDRTSADTSESLYPLSPGERTRYERFVFARDKALFLRAHTLKRVVLASYVGGDPKDLIFEQNAFGKPFLRPIAGQLCPRFNLSHTHGMIALAVTQEAEIGVDVEDADRAGKWQDLIDVVLTPTEQSELWACPEPGRGQRFYELWTLKEAYVKARGMGLTLPLQGFSISIRPGQAPTIEFTQQFPDDAALWRFACFPIGSFRLSVAIRASQPWTIRFFPELD